MMLLRSSLSLAAGLLVLAGVSLGAGPATSVPAGSGTATAAGAESGGLRPGGLPLQMHEPGDGQPLALDETSPAAGAPAAGGNEWVIAPIPFVSPMIGAGLAGGVGYIYHLPGVDKTLTPWTTLLGGFYSENKSWGVALGHKMNLRGDSVRLTGLVGGGYVKYDFYGVASSGGEARSVTLAQTLRVGSVEGLVRVREHLYVGLKYARSRLTTKVSGGDIPPWMEEIVARNELSADLSIPTLRMQWDSRDSSFYPTRGWLVDCDLALSDQELGSDFTYQALKLSAKHYWNLSDRQILGVYGYGRFAFGSVPFFALSMIGADSNLRGYSVGRYQDRMALTAQVEYRWQVWRRIGVVAFAGVGAVAPDLSGFGETTALPSVGGGVRYMLAETNKLNFRLDVAWGKNEGLLYLGVGEAF